MFLRDLYPMTRAPGHFRKNSRSYRSLSFNNNACRRAPTDRIHK